MVQPCGKSRATLARISNGIGRHKWLMDFPPCLELAESYLQANSYSQAETIIPSLMRANIILLEI